MVSEEDNSSSLKTCPITWARFRLLLVKFTSVEKYSNMSDNGGIGWLIISATSLCAFHYSYLQRRYLKTTTISEEPRRLCKHTMVVLVSVNEIRSFDTVRKISDNKIENCIDCRVWRIKSLLPICAALFTDCSTRTSSSEMFTVLKYQLVFAQVKKTCELYSCCTDFSSTWCYHEA